MSNSAVAHSREAAKRMRRGRRNAERAAKFAATAYHTHGYTIGEYETDDWNACVDWGKQQLTNNHDVALVEYMEAL